jgi:type IV pilus assembly protein PilQ
VAKQTGDSLKEGNMPVRQFLTKAFQRGALVISLLCFTALCAFANGASAPVATSLSATTSGASTFITISSTSPMAYSVTRPEAHTLLVNLPSVDASPLAAAYAVSTPLVSNVMVERELHANSTSARLRVTLRTNVQERLQLDDKNLVLVLSPDDNANTQVEQTGSVKTSTVNASDSIKSNQSGTIDSQTGQLQQNARPAPTPERSVTITAADNTMPQASQGKQYGQQGFVGEPINLNVVNADIRDILNYITEQYGVNFVIDKSVTGVPVTVNVTDVPWNVALDAILRANRLGIDVSGNILRVATVEVLASETASQRLISESRLDNSPLQTEFIRLNYARASGTLAQTAGSTGAFAGGSTNTSYSGGAGGDATGGGGDQGLMPIISRRLSRRGSIEVDGRSNTLIVTDVKENIEAVRQLIAILDQPEPQVEIETRIVIANRSFSRDLGVQLSAVGINASRGGLANFSTLPGTGDLTSGPSPFGIPGGLAGTAQPVNSLRAAAANTVIGLTTGIFGTAQISAAITAAENKGQAKIIATPRITVLNNRPAQIESGSQIPVQTTQAAGGTAVVTTTFVSVPLRLSVTPQITDAGTVILRVTAENNSLNGAIAVGGIPGIDTQRMQSEVLVPDGGTTVMGGVLADNESETQNRTPGLGSIPVVGNLFKRKAIQRQTNELLFFITPRIYRPDYQGRPVVGTVSTGTRTTTISQPVPMGNPQSNTPTPTQLQQMQNQPQTQQQNVPGLNTISPSVPAGTPSAPTARPGALGGQRP